MSCYLLPATWTCFSDLKLFFLEISIALAVLNLLALCWYHTVTRAARRAVKMGMVNHRFLALEIVGLYLMVTNGQCQGADADIAWSLGYKNRPGHTKMSSSLESKALNFFIMITVCGEGTPVTRRSVGGKGQNN